MAVSLGCLPSATMRYDVPLALMTVSNSSPIGASRFGDASAAARAAYLVSIAAFAAARDRNGDRPTRGQFLNDTARPPGFSARVNVGAYKFSRVSVAAD